MEELTDRQKTISLIHARMFRARNPLVDMPTLIDVCARQASLIVSAVEAAESANAMVGREFNKHVEEAIVGACSVVLCEEYKVTH